MAEVVTGEVVSQGHLEGYKPNGWIKGVDHHLPAAIGHAIDADRMRRGLKAEDAEGVEKHLSHALTRIAMALYCVKEEKKRPIAISTWNVNGSYDAVKLENLAQVFDTFNDSATIPSDLVEHTAR